MSITTLVTAATEPKITVLVTTCNLSARSSTPGIAVSVTEPTITVKIWEAV